jgi:hypothetical protein
MGLQQRAVAIMDARIKSGHDSRRGNSGHCVVGKESQAGKT